MDTSALVCLIICIVLGITMLIVLVSMGSLEPLEYGITYNKFTKTIGTDVYESGRYFIGPFKGFIIYPSNLVTIEFSNNRKAVVSQV